MVVVLGQNRDGQAPDVSGFPIRTRRFRLADANLAPQGRRAGGVQPAITLVEVALTICIAVLAGKAFWTLFAPLPIAQSPPAPAQPLAVSGAANPFRSSSVETATPAAAAPVAVETSLDLKLHGVWADGAGRGTAIILVAGAPQKVFRIGDDICCGAKLEEVYADRAIISRGGAREAIYLPNGRTPARAVQPASQGQIPNAGASILTIQPVDSGDGVMQLRLFPVQDAAGFEAIGLRPGDILVSVNGAPPGDAGAVMRVISALSRDDVVTLSVKRDGVEFPLDVTVGELMGAPAMMSD